MRHKKFMCGLELVQVGLDRKFTAHHYLSNAFYLPKVMGRGEVPIEERDRIFIQTEREATAFVWGLIGRRLFQTAAERLPWYWIKHYGDDCKRAVERKTVGVIETAIGSFIRPCCEAVIFVDDSSTMGVFHPATPLELATLMREDSTKSFDVVKWIFDYEEGNIPRKGAVVGQDEENTCPQCGEFLTSGATRSTVFYNCESCGYDRKEDNANDPCPR